MKKNKISLMAFALGIVLIIAAILFLGKNVLEQRAAEQQSGVLLAQAQQHLNASTPSTESEEKDEKEEFLSQEPHISSPNSFNWSNYNIDGILSLPDLGLELPVLADYSDALLKVSVCIFEKEDIQGSPRMVIAGHNYKAHFRNLSQLPIGSEISYQTMDGKVTKFQVTEIVEIDAKNVDALEEGTWDLTLLTCNYDMSKRILARCVSVEA